MAEVLIDHIRVNVGVGVEAATVGRVAEAVSLLLFVFSLFGLLLADFFHCLNLVLLLKVALFDRLDSALILLLKRFKLVHAHVHDIVSG